MTLADRITQDLTAAMKAKDAPRTSTLRMAKAAIKNQEIEKRGVLDDPETAKVLQTLVKQREDAAEQYRKGGREELATQELNEAELLRSYLPAAASEEEIAQAVERAVAETGASSPKDMGRVMKAAMANLAALGRTVDGKAVNAAVRGRLAG